MKILSLNILAIIFTTLCFGQTPFAYYPFNGNANDAIGANHGTVIGATLTNDRFGNPNSAYSFDGNDYIPLNFNTNFTSGFTIIFDVNIATIAAPGLTYEIVSKRSYCANSPSDFPTAMQIGSDGKMSILLGQGIDYHAQAGLSTLICLNQWVRFAMVYKANEFLSIYQDGILLETTPINFTIATNSQPWTVGRASAQTQPSCGFNESFLNGKVDEIKIYNTSLTAAQVLAEFNEPIGPDTRVSSSPCPLASTWYLDFDNDGYSDGTTLEQPTRPVGYKLASELTATNGDCNDANSAIHPDATEICDGIDNDCDAQTDEGCTAWYFDFDRDGFGNTSKVVYALTQPKKYVATPGDCRDWDAAFNPGAKEICDNKDNDCDGLIDEDGESLIQWYFDRDGDGFGDCRINKRSCVKPTGFVLVCGDCKDWNAKIYPGHGCPPVPPIVTTESNNTQPKATVETASEILVFPNPASNEIIITLNGFEAGKKVEMQMVMADGKVVMGQSLVPYTNSQQVRMDVRKLNVGFYLLQVRQGVMQQTKKVMIVR